MTGPVTEAARRPGAELRVIGAEIREGADGPGRVGAAVLELLGELPTGARILLVGPHADDLVARLAAAGHRVDLVLRSLTDAEATAPRLPGGVTVHCGSPQRLDERYDVVLALAGLDRLVGADAPVDGWLGALDALAALVGDRGRLAVTVHNGLGIDRLTAAGVASEPRSDEYAGNLAGLDAALAAAGLRADARVALFPDPAAPAVFAPEALLVGGAEPLGTVLAAAWQTGTDKPLTDRRRLVRDALDHGLGLALAPGWLVLARRPDAPGWSPRMDALLLTDAAHESLGAAPQWIARDADGAWRRTRLPLGASGTTGGAGPVGPTGAVDTASMAGAAGAVAAPRGAVARETERLDGPVPAGRLLEEELLAAAGRYDMATVRELLARYAHWLGLSTTWHDGTASTPADECPPERVFAVADNVVDDGTDLVAFDPSWRWSGPVRADVAFAAAMLRFAGRVLGGALPHPWATMQSPARLAARLVSMVGRTVTDEELALAAEIEAAAGTILGPVPTMPIPTMPVPTMPVAPPAAGAAAAKPMPEYEPIPSAAAPGLPVDASGPLATPAGYAEAVRTAAAAAAELAAAHEQIHFLAEVIAERDARLAKARKQLSSRTFRLARTMVKGARTIVGLIQLKRFRGGK